MKIAIGRIPLNFCFKPVEVTGALTMVLSIGVVRESLKGFEGSIVVQSPPEDICQFVPLRRVEMVNLAKGSGLKS